MQQKNTQLEDIFKIVAWFDVFDHVIREEELRIHLNPPFVKEDFQAVSPPLIKGVRGICSKDGYLFLAGKENLLQKRKISDEISKKLWKRINFYTPLFKRIPFIKMIAVCNTLAFGCPDSDSDIDLFIITEKNRLFISRTILTLLTSILGIRRHGNKVKARFCLSFWISEEAMDFEKIQIKGGDPYLAFWALTLKPIFGEETYKKFLEINQKWINDRIHLNPSFVKEGKNPPNPLSPKGGVLSSILCSLFSVLESVLRSWQLKRCKAKMKNLNQESSNIVNEKMLKFHNVDRRKFYREEWEKRVKQRL